MNTYSTPFILILVAFAILLLIALTPLSIQAIVVQSQTTDTNETLNASTALCRNGTKIDFACAVGAPIRQIQADTLWTWQQEAELGIITNAAHLAIRSAPDASECDFVQTIVGWNSGRLEFNFAVSTSGYYWLWARAAGAGWDRNSFWVSIDNQPEFQYEIPQQGNIWTWGWSIVHDENQPEGPLYLSAGNHMLRFGSREIDSRLDKIILANSSSLVPGAGDVTPCGQASPTPTPTSTFTPTPTRTFTPTPSRTPTPTPSRTPTPTPTSTPDSSCPTIIAWKGEYWNNETLSGSPALCRNDASIDFEWAVGSPAPQIQADHFSARWTRNLSFSAGTYRFVMFHDDGARLYIDGALVFQNWCNDCRATDTVDVPLTAGTHAIRMEMRENIGWAAASLSWSQLPAVRRHIPLVMRGFAPFPGALVLSAIAPPGANPSYNVTWSAPTWAAFYLLQRATSATFANAIQVYAGPNTSYQAPSQGIARYHYRVQARNQSGSSPWSNVQSVDVRWELEPNNSADVANGPLNSGLDYYGFPNDVSDYFTFETSTRGQITIDLNNHTGQGIQLLLYQAAGNLVQQDIEPPYRLEYMGDPGRYYVRVYSTGGFNITTRYTLRVVIP